MVLVLTAAPVGLRGELTKWLLEINPGVYVGNPSKRIREELWDRTCAVINDGRAVLVYSSDGEQRLKFDVHQHSWQPIDIEGLTLIQRPTTENKRPQRRKGWSKARAQYRSRNPSWRSKYQ